MLCTKPPPKRVVIFALRWSSRMTVSEPETFGAARSRCAREPKSCVTVRRVCDGALPAPAPQPRSSAASAPRSAGSAASRPALANVEHTAVAAPIPHGVAVERPVDRLDVEHVVPAREALGQEVAEVGAVADGEEEPGAGAALRADEPLALAAEREAAVADAAREAQLHCPHARATLGDGDPDEARREARAAVGVAVARAEQPRARGGAVDGDPGDALGGALRGLRRRADGDDERVGADRAGLRRLEALNARSKRHGRVAGGVGRRCADGRARDRLAGLLIRHLDAE